jgi:hypothetical protein
MTASFAPGKPPIIGEPRVSSRVSDLSGYDLLSKGTAIGIQRPPNSGYIRRIRLDLEWASDIERLLERRR